MNMRNYVGAAVVAATGSCALTFFNPQFGSSVMMAAGVGLMGYSVAREEAARKEQFKIEANKVGATFKYLYETNRGIVVPAQLAFHSDINVERASDFLSQLAQTQGGNAIAAENGTNYMFPHPQGVVEDLEQRYMRYADSQIQSQTAQLNQQLMNLQAHLNVLSAAQTAVAPPVKPQSVPETNEIDDPWNKLM